MTSAEKLPGLTAGDFTVANLRTVLFTSEQGFSVKRVMEVYVGAPAVVLADDGALLLEWTRGQRRVGINVEVNPRDSGWYFVSLEADAPGSASGSMKDLDVGYLCKRLAG